MKLFRLINAGNKMKVKEKTFGIIIFNFFSFFRYPCLFIAIFVLITALAPLRSEAVETADEKDAIIERVIKIEGAVEKPRVIFIVPKAKLWSGSITVKSYRDEFLKPLYPDDAAFKEITTGK